MSRRITLSVPDALHDQIERWRESFNLSRVFQDAVAELIRRREAMQSRLKEELPQVIARLKREKQEAEAGWFEKGEEAGLAWARNAHWLELKQSIERPVVELASPGGMLSDYFRELLRRELNGVGDGADELTDRFLAGWRNGVCEFWTLVKDKLG